MARKKNRDKRRRGALERLLAVEGPDIRQREEIVTLERRLGIASGKQTAAKNGSRSCHHSNSICTDVTGSRRSDGMGTESYRALRF